MARMRTAKPNLLDRLVGYFDPRSALQRLHARTQYDAAVSTAGGYKGGRRDRRATKNWHPGGGSADADLNPQRDDLIARSRDLARNLPVATGAISTNITHVIGDGLRLNAQIDRETLGLNKEAARAFNRKVEAEFALWCKQCDFTGVQHFNELQALVFRSTLESGDVFILRRFRRHFEGQTMLTKLQVIEADRVANPHYRQDTDRLVAGIEHNDDGWPLAVHVANRHPGDLYRRPNEWRRVPMRYRDGRPIVLHVFDRLRPGQTRGIPYLAPVVEALKQLGDYADAEVQAAVISAMFTVFVTNAPDQDSGPLPSSEDSGTGGKEEVEMAPGAIVDLAQGEDIKVANPGRPNPEFEAFVTAFLRQIGVALELPFELLIKHFTASYSASRAALEMAYHYFRRRRTWLARNCCQPIYEWFMEEAVLRGRLECPGFFDDPAIREAWLSATWTGPVRISLDPKKDAEADEIDLRNRVKTRQQVMDERTGGDFDMKIEQASREKAKLEAAGFASEPAARAAAPAVAPPDDPDDETNNEDA